MAEFEFDKSKTSHNFDEARLEIIKSALSGSAWNIERNTPPDAKDKVTKDVVQRAINIANETQLSLAKLAQFTGVELVAQVESEIEQLRAETDAKVAALQASFLKNAWRAEQVKGEE